MIGDHEDLKDQVDESEDTIVDIDSDDGDDDISDNIGESSVEFDIDALIAELEAESGLTSKCKSSDPRKRLESILEERRARKEAMEFDDFAYDTFDTTY